MTQSLSGAGVKRRRRDRDTQRGRLYAAEKVLRQFATQLPEAADLKRLVRQVWASKRVQKGWPRAIRFAYQQAPPKVVLGRGARGNQVAIRIPEWGRTDWLVLHELAHTIHLREIAGDPRREHEAFHGWQYAEIYLRLILLFMGRPAHDALKAAFKANKVRFRAPRRGTPLSPERKAELAARLAQARERKIWAMATEAVTQLDAAARDLD